MIIISVDIFYIILFRSQPLMSVLVRMTLYIEMWHIKDIMHT